MALRRRNEQVKPVPTGSTGSTSDFFNDIMTFVNKGEVIPIISNSLRIEQIFRQTSETTDVENEELTLDEELTREWAKEISYPMADDYNLPRVAQYYQVDQKESLLAKAKYLKFLKKYLLDINEEDQDYKDIVSQMRIQEANFSQIVQKLDYPRFPEGVEDPLRLLAKLPLKIYVTTSYYNFMEQALEAEQKKPRTRIIFWSSGSVSAKSEPSYEPSDTEPTVFHLYGLEDHPQTLVLSEDDFMDFLEKITKDTNNQNPGVPLSLQAQLAEYRLLLLGYRVQDWDFRVLFRFLLEYRVTNSVPRGMLIQLKPGAKQSGNKEKSIEYLSHYFDKKQFDVEWTNTETFIRDLWNEWDKSRKGQ